MKKIQWNLFVVGFNEAKLSENCVGKLFWDGFDEIINNWVRNSWIPKFNDEDEDIRFGGCH